MIHKALPLSLIALFTISLENPIPINSSATLEVELGPLEELIWMEHENKNRKILLKEEDIGTK